MERLWGIGELSAESKGKRQGSVSAETNLKPPLPKGGGSRTAVDGGIIASLVKGAVCAGGTHLPLTEPTGEIGTVADGGGIPIFRNE